MIVYCIEHKESGKRYIGKTIKTLDFRWQAHVRESNRGSDLPIHAAIRKYGKDAFVVSILASCETIEQMDSLEIQKIEELQTHTSFGKGYNATWGGDGTQPGEKHPWYGRHHTEESKEKLSLAKRGDKNPSFGKKGESCHNFGLIRSEETKEKIRAARLIQGNPRIDYTVSPEIKEKIRSTLLAQVTPEFRERQSQFGKLGAQSAAGMAKARHVRWHVNRGITNPDCGLCAS